MSKETYSVKVDGTDKERLKCIPQDTVRNVLNMLCEAYSEGESGSMLFVFEVEKEYTLQVIESHKKAIGKLEGHLSEIENKIAEHKEVHIKEQKELDKAWQMLYIAHFEKESLNSVDDVYRLLYNCTLMDIREVVNYCIGKVYHLKKSIPPEAATYKKMKKECEWLLKQLEYLLTDTCNY